MAKTLFIQFLLMISGYGAMAQDAAEVKEVQSPNNMLAFTMMVVAVILGFVVFTMGQVLITLTRQVLEKQKAAKAGTILLLILGFTLATGNVHAQETTDAAAEAVKVIPNYGGLAPTAFWALITVIGTEVLVILVFLLFINRMKRELLPAVQKKTLPLLEWWKRMDRKFFTNAVAVEQESAIELEHDYDGIKELDNSLPPWWKWGFIITIGFSCIYLLNFHVFGAGKNPSEEYEEELAKAKVQLEAYNAKNKDKVDEANLQPSDASGIAKGKEIFQSVCWACHGKEGEGGTGPNLTDDYWLHKGALSDVYQSIKHGYPDKGMQAWEKQYSPKDVLNLASFIKSIHGTHPANAKPPQGDLFTEAAVSDSTTVTADSAAVKKS
ncbi:MAG: cbb3-type cytochrome c oxidase N-terminal domain-containing protein [Ferruginibacter sp.]